MVGMDPTEAKSKGVLGVMADQQPESPEEQYDRLVRSAPDVKPSVTPYHETVFFALFYTRAGAVVVKSIMGLWMRCGAG